ncbi:MAG: NERD domain-containing protein [Microbacteriaceae bacterium]
MVRMIPAEYGKSTNFGEKQVFDAFNGVRASDDWIVLHGLDLAHNEVALEGESDFVVMVPGAGIVVIEVKNAKSIHYENGEWRLEGVPKARKNPLDQVKNARRAIRGFVQGVDDIDDVPIATLLWFPRIGRYDLDAHRGQGGEAMSFYEWEMAWGADLPQPTQLIEKVLSNFMRDYGEREQVSFTPSAFTAERAKLWADHLVGSLHAEQSPDDRRRERHKMSQAILAEQLTHLDLIESNEHIYFDGSAGTGKSFMLTESAKRLARSGRRVLVTCWNYMMADELAKYAGVANVVVKDLNTVMLDITGMRNPKNADSNWYQVELPRLTVEKLEQRPDLVEFDALCVDEFQDVAGSAPLLNMLFRLVQGGSTRASRIVLAGDKNQQIMRAGDEVDPFEVAKSHIGDLVRVRLTTNIRNSAALGRQIRHVTGLPDRDEKFMLDGDVVGVGGALTVRSAKDDRAQATALRKELDRLLTEFQPNEIRILSPFGTRSLAYKLMFEPGESKDARWLKTKLRQEGGGGGGAIRWRSISKFKGLESDVVIITDINEEAEAFARESGKTLNELLYVGMSRARYHVVLIGSKVPKG